MGDDRCSLFWGLRAADYRAVVARGFDAWRGEVIRLAPAAAELFESISSFDAIALARYQHVWMPRTYSRRTVFLGDAAHAMSPYLGQGVGLALVDALSLAESIDRHLTPAAAFAAHAVARRIH